MIVEANGEMEDSPSKVFFEGGLLCLGGKTTGSGGSMPLVVEVILIEDNQTGITDLDFTSNRRVCDDVEVRCGMEATM